MLRQKVDLLHSVEGDRLLGRRGLRASALYTPAQVPHDLLLTLFNKMLIGGIYQIFGKRAFSVQSDFVRLLEWVNVEVDQPPQFKESMQPDDGSSISGKMSSTCCCRKIA